MAQATKLASGIGKLPGAALRYVREARDELKKVSWPSRETTIQFTIAVVVASLVIGGVTGGIDYVLSKFVERII